MFRIRHYIDIFYVLGLETMLITMLVFYVMFLPMSFLHMDNSLGPTHDNGKYETRQESGEVSYDVAYEYGFSDDRARNYKIDAMLERAVPVIKEDLFQRIIEKGQYSLQEMALKE